MTREEHDYDTCECGRCIRRRVWAALILVETELRDLIARERAAKLNAEELR